MARIETANQIINDAALDVGLSPDPDPVGSADQNFVQMTGLLSSAGRELVELHPWQTLEKEYSFNTDDDGATGVYDLPADFSYMIDQTGWDNTNKLPVGGPLTVQDWAYLRGRDLASSTIYVSFRLLDGNMRIFPQPPPSNLEISFRYIQRNWAGDFGSTTPNQDRILVGSDVVFYEPILITKFLKAKFLEAKGFDSTAARLEFENMMVSRTGKDTGAPILSASGPGTRFPYLNPYYNTPDTNYGS